MRVFDNIVYYSHTRILHLRPWPRRFAMPKSIEKSNFDPLRIKNFSSTPTLHRPSHSHPLAVIENLCIN